MKWPILDATGNPVFSELFDTSNTSQNEVILSSTSESDFCPAARPLSTIPIPPVPRVLQSNHIIPTIGRLSESESISSSIGDSLNPDVPEFIPNEPVMSDSKSEPFKIEKQLEKVKSFPLSSSDDSLLFSKNESLEQENKTSASTKCSSPNSVPEMQVNGESQSVNDVWKEVIFFSCLISTNIKIKYSRFFNPQKKTHFHFYNLSKILN